MDASAYASAVTSGLNKSGDITQGCPNPIDENNITSGFDAGKGIGSSYPADTFSLNYTYLGQQTVDTMTYTAGAAGKIHKSFTDDSGPQGLSLMTINELKVIKIIQNGFWKISLSHLHD